MKTLDSLVERFEQAVAEHGVESIAPQDIVAAWETETMTKVSSEVITELLRVWLEYRFASQMAVSLQQAIALFPNVAFSESELQILQFEYHRLTAGPSSIEESFSLNRKATDALPAVGDTWDDFLLLEQLGEGAFARVYLARQLSMAGRLVALKLTFRATMESQLLARLHHSAIVPIYSMHQHAEVYGLCMPYLGNTTLLDLLREISPNGKTHFGSMDTADGADLLEILVHRQARITTVANTAADQETRDNDSRWLQEKADSIQLNSERSAESDGSQSEVQQRHHVEVDSHGANAVDSSKNEASPLRQNRIATAKELSKFDYVGAITWIGSQLADALDHAHRHGVLHCDIKPANVLLAPDGQARLLDFNVSLEHSNLIEDVRVGGTLAYMAPEHLIVVQGAGKSKIDERSDIYSLGIVLYEMLAGVVPKQHATEDPTPIRQMLQQANSSVTPALAAIINKCLANEPQARYASAAQLYDDLNAQCNNLPLIHQPEPSIVERTNKWVRRHPLLTSVSSVSMLAACLVAIAFAGFLWRGNKLEQMQRVSRGERVQQLLPAAIATVSALRNYPELRAEAMAQSSQVCELLREGPGHSLDLSVVKDLAPLQTLVRLAKSNGLEPHKASLQGSSEAHFGEDAAENTFMDLGSFADHVQQLDEALEDKKSRRMPEDDLLDAYLDGRYPDVLELGKQLPQSRASDYATWMFLGQSNLKVENFAAARECFSVCITLRPDIEVAWFYRGIARLESKQFEAAIEDFTRAIEIKSKFPSARYNMALAYDALGEKTAALDVLNIAIAAGWQSVSGYAFRAKLNQQLGNMAEATQDVTQAIACRPTSELDWVRRGTLLLPSDPALAKQAFEQAIRLNPNSIPGRQNLAHVLAEELSEPEASLEHLDVLVKLDPSKAERWAGRGVVLARLGRLSEAISDLSHASTMRISSPLVAYQVACGYSLVASQMDEKVADKSPQSGLPSQSQISDAANKWYTYSVQSRPEIAEIAKTDPDVAWLLRRRQFNDATQNHESGPRE